MGFMMTMNIRIHEQRVIFSEETSPPKPEDKKTKPIDNANRLLNLRSRIRQQYENENGVRIGNSIRFRYL